MVPKVTFVDYLHKEIDFEALPLHPQFGVQLALHMHDMLGLVWALWFPLANTEGACNDRHLFVSSQNRGRRIDSAGGRMLSEPDIPVEECLSSLLSQPRSPQEIRRLMSHTESQTIESVHRWSLPQDGDFRVLILQDSP